MEDSRWHVPQLDRATAEQRLRTTWATMRSLEGSLSSSSSSLSDNNKREMPMLKDSSGNDVALSALRGLFVVRNSSKPGHDALSKVWGKRNVEHWVIASLPTGGYAIERSATGDSSVRATMGELVRCTPDLAGFCPLVNAEEMVARAIKEQNSSLDSIGRKSDANNEPRSTALPQQQLQQELNQQLSGSSDRQATPSYGYGNCAEPPEKEHKGPGLSSGMTKAAVVPSSVAPDRTAVARSLDCTAVDQAPGKIVTVGAAPSSTGNFATSKKPEQEIEIDRSEDGHPSDSIAREELDAIIQIQQLLLRRANLELESAAELERLASLASPASTALAAEAAGRSASIMLGALVAATKADAESRKVLAHAFRKISIGDVSSSNGSTGLFGVAETGLRGVAEENYSLACASARARIAGSGTTDLDPPEGNARQTDDSFASAVRSGTRAHLDDVLVAIEDATTRQRESLTSLQQAHQQIKSLSQRR